MGLTEEEEKSWELHQSQRSRWGPAHPPAGSAPWQQQRLINALICANYSEVVLNYIDCTLNSCVKVGLLLLRWKSLLQLNDTPP